MSKPDVISVEIVTHAASRGQMRSAGREDQLNNFEVVDVRLASNAALRYFLQAALPGMLRAKMRAANFIMQACLGQAESAKSMIVTIIRTVSSVSLAPEYVPPIL